MKECLSQLNLRFFNRCTSFEELLYFAEHLG